MPNWITNIVTFSGDEKIIAKLKEQVKGEQSEFDFNKIAPIPKELEGTQSPTKIVTQEEYDKQEERITKGELTKEEKDWGLSRGLTQELVNEYKEKFGFADWYGWQSHNWGTKWNACDVIDMGEGFEFRTAWATPYNIFLKLSEMYPEIEIHVRYSDEDFGYNVGEYTLLDEEEIETYQPDGGSEEALELAMEIQYGTPSDYFECNEEMFGEYIDDDEEELGEYELTMIDIAYKHGVYPYEGCEYHKLVLERFKELAMADENYELVAVIQKELDKVKSEDE